ncbi:hypothetical protein FD755_012628 [Muntiacus reevesi]|uniref:NADH dehydrogenase [ubiquinone] 1 alpha subcomplex subunit 5 n=1 Tax=Muntiacus reevesi TaxID=9886 RepID=A0A5N3XPN0_MUNRE|nr:hypothetical protein FD755_012628 [Muntiacus reevesi]
MAGLLKKVRRAEVTAGVCVQLFARPGTVACQAPLLKILYTKILDVLGHIPKNAAYRKYTEQITNEKLSMVKALDIEKAEESEIKLLTSAENELSLARKMIQWKPWEPLVEEPPASQWKWPI